MKLDEKKRLVLSSLERRILRRAVWLLDTICDQEQDIEMIRAAAKVSASIRCIEEHYFANERKTRETESRQK